MVAVFLLHAGRQRGFRPRSSRRDQARPARHLKATDICAAEPERAAQQLVDGGFTERYDYALQTLTKCRTAGGASTTPRIRCASMRCGCTRSGMIKSSPNQLIAEGTDWRFLERAQARAEGMTRLRGAPAGLEIAERRLPMRIIQSRRDFLASLSLAGAAGVSAARASLADEGAAGSDHAAAYGSPPSALPRVCGRGAAAGGRLHRCPLRATPGGAGREVSRVARSTSA